MIACRESMTGVEGSFPGAQARRDEGRSLSQTAPRKAIAFVYSQEDGKKDLRQAAMSVGEVENATGFEFIIAPDTKERKLLQTKFNLSDWKETKCP